jgi:hypothetical protein
MLPYSVWQDSHGSAEYQFLLASDKGFMMGSPQSFLVALYRRMFEVAPRKNHLSETNQN